MPKILKWFLIRLPFVLILSVLCLIGALKLVEGHPDALKQGLEEFFSGASQTRTTIGTVDKAVFFPSIEVELNDMTFHDASNVALIPLTIQKLDVSFPFSSMFLNHGRFEEFLLENWNSNAGFLSKHQLKISKAHMVEKNGPEQYGHFIKAMGNYNDVSLSFEAKVDKLKKGYRIPRPISFALQIGEYELNAQYDNRRTLRLVGAVLTKGGQSSDAHTYELLQEEQYNKNNPFNCLLEADELAECDIYLERADK